MLVNRSFYSPVLVSKTDTNQAETNRFVPAADVLETESSYEIVLSLPGVDKSAIKIEIQDQSLKISGERANPDLTDKKMLRNELRYGVFHRSFRLPRLVDRNAILANYENGLLRITLPKDSAQTLVNVIEVK